MVFDFGVGLKLAADAPARCAEEVVVACGAHLATGGDIGVHHAHGVEAVGLHAAGGADTQGQTVGKQLLADHNVGEEAEDGGAVCGVGIPGGGKTSVELQAAEDKVDIRVGLHDVAPQAHGVIHGRQDAAKGHLVAQTQAIGVGIPLHVQIGHTLVLAHHLEAVTHVAAEVNVKLVLPPCGPQVAEMHIGSEAKLVGVELHVLDAEVPRSHVIRGTVVLDGYTVARIGGIDGCKRAVVEAVVQVVVVLIAEVGG